MFGKIWRKKTDAFLNKLTTEERLQVSWLREEGFTTFEMDRQFAEEYSRLPKGEDCADFCFDEAPLTLVEKYYKEPEVPKTFKERYGF